MLENCGSLVFVCLGYAAKYRQVVDKFSAKVEREEAASAPAPTEPSALVGHVIVDKLKADGALAFPLFPHSFYFCMGCG